MTSSSLSSFTFEVPNVFIEILTGSSIPIAYAIPISHLSASLLATIFLAMYLA